MIIHKYRGRGLVNKLINNLPVELHLPGYQYCGPGTSLTKRLARGDKGINPLDAACKEHDISYSKNPDIKYRHTADKTLAEKAWSRVMDKDAGLGEKAAAYAVANAMKLKTKLGMGLKRKIKRRRVTGTLSKIIQTAKKSMIPSTDSKVLINSALKGALSTIKKLGGKNNVTIPRILKVPTKVGGVVPFLIPLFAGLSATGALAGGAAGIVKAINDVKAGKKQLEETHRHNKKMEAIAIGRGLYLKPYKKGFGLYLKPHKGKGLKKKKHL